MGFVKGLLQRMQLIPFKRQSLDGDNFLACGLHGKHKAGADCLAIHQNSAGAADAMLTADVGSGEPEFMTQEVAE